MASIPKFRQEEFDSLEVQANTAYEALKRAVKSYQHKDVTGTHRRAYLDALWSVSLYNALSLSINHTTKAYFPNYWSRGTQRADLTDRFTLQFVLGLNLSNYLMDVTQHYELNESGQKLHKELTSKEKQRYQTGSYFIGKYLDMHGEEDLTIENVKAVLDNKRRKYHVNFWRRLEEMSKTLAGYEKFDTVFEALDYVRSRYKMPNV